MEEVLKQVYGGNSVLNYLIAIGVFTGTLLLVRLLRQTVTRYLKQWALKSDTTFDDMVVEIIQKNILPVLNIGALYLAARYLVLSPKIDRALNIIYGLVITWFVVRMLLSIIRNAADNYAEKQEDPVTKKRQLRSLLAIVQAVIWLIALIVLFSNLGFNVTGIVAGLGIGGIAIALAAQAILGDLFSYFVIFFDKPFEPGDYITVDDKRGTVEKVGLKTTRVRALTGEQMIFSNTNLTNSRIHNFKRLERRRVAFTLGVTYETPFEKLKAIPDIIQTIIATKAQATFDRTHLIAFAEFSLNFEVVYFVEVPDLNVHMDLQQQILFEIFQQFEKAGIHFAYPTQTVYEHKMPAGMAPNP